MFMEKLNEKASEKIEMQKLILTYTKNYCWKQLIIMDQKNS